MNRVKQMPARCGWASSDQSGVRTEHQGGERIRWSSWDTGLLGLGAQSGAHGWLSWVCSSPPTGWGPRGLHRVTGPLERLLCTHTCVSVHFSGERRSARLVVLQWVFRGSRPTLVPLLQDPGGPVFRPSVTDPYLPLPWSLSSFCWPSPSEKCLLKADWLGPSPDGGLTRWPILAWPQGCPWLLVSS